MPEPVSQTAILLLVPEAEPVVRRWRAEYDPSAAAGVPAHVTVLYPWLPADEVASGDLAALAEIVGRCGTLDLSFAGFGQFPQALWLAPEPAEPIRRLTAAVSARWPAYPPYGGVHDVVIPHLTLAHGPDPGELGHIVADVGPRLPIRARISEVTLVAQLNGDAWAVRERFPLGPAPADAGPGRLV